MKILIVSDTHGRDAVLKSVLEAVKPIDMLVHCGMWRAARITSGLWQSARSIWWREIMIFSVICRRRRSSALGDTGCF